MPKVYIYTEDRLYTTFYTEQETLELFGDLEDTIDLPNELHADFLKARDEFRKQVNRLSAYLKGKELDHG